MAWKPVPPQPRQRLSREQKKKQTRILLLDAAQALFASKGMEATTVDEISTAAGFTRGAFYAHFENKEHLMRELIASGFEGDTEAIEVFEGRSDPTDLAAVYQTYSTRFTEEPDSLMWALEFQMAALRHPELRQAYNDQTRQLRDRVKDVIQATIGKPSPADLARLNSIAEAMISLQVSLSARRLLDPDQVPEDVFRQVFEIVLRGMADQD